MKNLAEEAGSQQKWFSIHELATLSGYDYSFVSKFVSGIYDNDKCRFSDLCKANSKSVGSAHKKYYNAKVIEAIKAYQLSAHGNTKNADVQNETTASLIQNATQMVSFKALMESGNIEAVKEYMNVCLAYTESVSKSKQLESENNQLKHALEYDQIVGWKAWNKLKNEWKEEFEELNHRVSFKELIEKAALEKDVDFKNKVMGNDKFPTTIISPSGEDKLWNYFDR